MKTYSAESTVILVTGDGMGQTDSALRHQLLRSYLKLLDDSDLHPGAICFYAGGVKMALENSPVLDELKALEQAGVPIILCGTCLNYYQVVDETAVGIQGGMTDILEAQMLAEKVITL